MKTILIDADSLCYINGDDIDHVLGKVDDAISNIVAQSEATHYKVFVEHPFNNNFRKKIVRSYKQNRAGKPLPEFYNDIKSYLIGTWGGYGLGGYETDDVIISSVRYIEDKYPFTDVVVATMDKDYAQYPITIFDTYYRRFGDIRNISLEQSNYSLWSQMITGDFGDNIKGVKGKGKVTAEKLLDGSKNAFISVCRLYRQVYGSRWQKEFIKNYVQIRLLDNLNVGFELDKAMYVEE
jgi:5'-3' exonuclease